MSKLFTILMIPLSCIVVACGNGGSGSTTTDTETTEDTKKVRTSTKDWQDLGGGNKCYIEYWDDTGEVKENTCDRGL